MKYNEYDLHDINGFNKFRSIEKATNPGKNAKGYIYGIKSPTGFRVGTLSVRRQSPYEYFTHNQYLGTDERRCIVILSEPHLNYKQNLSLIEHHELFENVVFNLATDYSIFKTLLKSLTIDGKFIETDEWKPETKEIEKPTKDIKFSSMDKSDLYIYLYNQNQKIEKENAIINEHKAKRDEIHTLIKNAETRLKQLL